MDISKIIIDLLLERPFFGVMVSKLTIVENPSIPTACTDGTTIEFNPTWIKELTYFEQIGLIAHEILHIVFKHHIRRQHRDQLKWNIACDMAINPLLVESGFVIPQCGLVDEHKPVRSAEEIYDSLPDSTSIKYDLWGEFKEPTGDLKEEEQKLIVNISEALSRSNGKLSPSLDRIINNMVSPIIPWYSILRQYITEIVRESYCSTKFSRRFIHQNIYLPSLYSKVLNLVLVIDTSGSITSEQLGEMTGILEDIRNDIATKLTVFSCDDHISHEDFFEENEPIELKLIGGGGTDFCPVFDELEKRKEDPDLLIYLTDGLCDSYPNRENLTFPVLWVYFKNEIEIEVW